MIRRQHHTTSKGQILLYIALLGVVIACMVALSHYDKPRTADKTHYSGGDTLDIAIEFSPTTYYSYDDTLGGYHYDLLRLISNISHRPMKFHPIVTLEEGLKGLQSGAYDVLAAQFPTTTHNREKFCFTQPVLIDQQVLVQRKPISIHSQLDLAGDTVHVVKGSPMVERIAGLSREIGDTIHVATDDTYGPEQLVMMVAAGDIKLAVVNRNIAAALAAKLHDIDTSIDISLSQFQAWTLAKYNVELRDSINNWINAIDKKQIETLRERYFVK